MVWPSWSVLASYTPSIGSSSSLSTECGRWINLKRFKMIILIFAAGGRWLASSCQWPHEGRTGEMIRNHCGHHWSNHLDHLHIIDHQVNRARRLRKIGKAPPAFPNGWFVLCESRLSSASSISSIKYHYIIIITLKRSSGWESSLSRCSWAQLCRLSRRIRTSRANDDDHPPDNNDDENDLYIIGAVCLSHFCLIFTPKVTWQ